MNPNSARHPRLNHATASFAGPGGSPASSKPRCHNEGVDITPSGSPITIARKVPAIAMAAVRTIAAPTTRRNEVEKSGGKRLRTKAQSAVEVPGPKRAVGRISAARQQTTNTATKASDTAARL